MKAYIKMKIFSFLMLLIVLLSGCTKAFKKLNTNPALVSEELVTPEFLLSGVQVGIGGGMGAAGIFENLAAKD